MNKPVIDWENRQPIEFPCEYCVGNSAIWDFKEDRYLTSQELCKEAGMCHSSVDWEKIYSHET